MSEDDQFLHAWWQDMSTSGSDDGQPFPTDDDLHFMHGALLLGGPENAEETMEFGVEHAYLSQGSADRFMELWNGPIWLAGDPGET